MKVRLLYNGDRLAMVRGSQLNDPLTCVWRGEVDREEALRSAFAGRPPRTEPEADRRCRDLAAGVAVYQLHNLDDRPFGNCFRSASVGDVIEVDGACSDAIAAIGFTRLSGELTIAGEERALAVSCLLPERVVINPQDADDPRWVQTALLTAAICRSEDDEVEYVDARTLSASLADARRAADRSAASALRIDTVVRYASCELRERAGEED